MESDSFQTYSDGTPAVIWSYDSGVANGIGRLGFVSNANSTTHFLGYDAMGRVTWSNQLTGGQDYVFRYGYNLAGSLTGETYPSGRQLTFSYDGSNRLTSVAGVLSGQTTPYVSNIAYAPHGDPAQYQ